VLEVAELVGLSLWLRLWSAERDRETLSTRGMGLGTRGSLNFGASRAVVVRLGTQSKKSACDACVRVSEGEGGKHGYEGYRGAGGRTWSRDMAG
jgi:hypothetical protein